MKGRCSEVVGLDEGTSWLMGFSQQRAAADGVTVQHKAGSSYRLLVRLRRNENCTLLFAVSINNVCDVSFRDPLNKFD